MRALITGVTGFVGGAVARAVVDNGGHVRGLVRVGADRGRLAGLEVEWVEGDVTEIGSLRGTFDGVDWVVHAAGMLGRAGVPESHYHRLHVDGTRNVLGAAKAAGNPRVLHVSSPGVLGPIFGEPADETAPLAPSNPYERSKAAAERVALDYAAAGLPVVIARPEFVYGPGDEHVLGLFRSVQSGRFFYVGRGKRTCHPTYVEDAVRGMLLCIERGRAGQVYHLAGPQPVTFRQLGETISAALEVRSPWLSLPRSVAWLGAAGLELAGRVLGRTPPLSRTGVAFFSEDRCFSWQKAHRELGYSPQMPLSEGARRTVVWYREQSWL